MVSSLNTAQIHHCFYNIFQYLFAIKSESVDVLLSPLYTDDDNFLGENPDIILNKKYKE